MFHMLSCFDLKPGEDIETFRNAYDEFAAYMKSVDLVADSGPVGRRQSDTPMDTDGERNHEYFVIMSFRDRAQVDAAYAYIKKHVEPGESSHNGVYERVENPIFICWQDLP
jgi:hypothetical protein